MISTTYYLHLPLLHRTYDIWEHSCDFVRECAGIVWSMSLQPISPTVISHSPFLQGVLPTLHSEAKTIVVAQLTETWINAKDTGGVKAAARSVINDINLVAEEAGMQTGYVYLNYAHEGQNVFGDGRMRDWLQGVNRNVDPAGIFQRCAVGGFKVF